MSNEQVKLNVPTVEKLSIKNQHYIGLEEFPLTHWLE